MDTKLLTTALIKVISGFLIMALLIFLPAGTLAYAQGWILLAILFIPMVIAGFVMFFKNPDLLRKRLNAKEEQAEQKTVVLLSAAIFIAVFILAGLNYRFEWCILPMGASIAGAAVFIAAYIMYAEVIRENTYLSRTIEVQEGQKVVDTGLYGIVRHPMYTSTIFLFLAMPIVLGSLISFAVMLLYIPIIAKRIKNEEQVLEQGLPGYTEYKQKVRYRLFPRLW